MTNVTFGNALGNFGQLTSFFDYENFKVVAHGNNNVPKTGPDIVVISDTTTDADIILHGALDYNSKFITRGAVFLADFFDANGDTLLTIDAHTNLDDFTIFQSHDLKKAVANGGVAGLLDYMFSGNDTFKGSDNSDYLFTGAGNDVIKAGKGDDWLIGEEGNDKLYGQAGNDIFFTSAHGGHDVVMDFDRHKGETDLIAVTTGYHASLNKDKTVLTIDYGDKDETVVYLNDHKFSASHDLYHF